MLLKRNSSTTHSNARFSMGTIGGQHLSCCFRDLLIPRSLPATSTVRRSCLARAGKLSSRRVLSENGYRSDWPLLGLRRWELPGLNQPRSQVLSPTRLSLSLRRNVEEKPWEGGWGWTRNTGQGSSPRKKRFWKSGLVWWPLVWPTSRFANFLFANVLSRPAEKRNERCASICFVLSAWYKKVRYACVYLVLSSTDQEKAVKELTQNVSETTSQISEQDVGETTLRRNDRKLLIWHSRKKKNSQKIKLPYQKKARLENVTWPKEFESYSENFLDD